MKTTTIKDQIARLEARLAIEEDRLEAEDFSSARNARDHARIRASLNNRINDLEELGLA